LITDPTPFSPWDMFRSYREAEWVATIDPLLARFPGEPAPG